MRKGKVVYFFLLSIFFFRISYSQVNLTSSNLPIVLIDTHGQQIPNEPKIPATMRIVDNGPGNRNEITGPFNDYDGNIGIEIRGSSSTMFDKKSYGLEIWDENLNDTIASILGMPAEEDWVLHGPYSDKSLMRNVLTFYLGRELGRYASRTRYIELIINNDYRGIYVFMERIKRDMNRVDIADLRPEENSGDDLTGGYIIKLDKFDGSNTGGGWASPYRPPGYQKSNQEIYFQFDYPKVKNITPEQQQYIQNYVTDFEEALRNRPSNDLVSGYKSYINLESFVDFAIINELSRNVDGYRLSTFLHKDKDSKDGKLYIGPIWDYNLAFGNADYYDGSNTKGWAWNFNFNPDANEDFWLIPFWWQRFQTDPEYINLLKSRWIQLRNGPYKTDSIMTFIDSTSDVLYEAQVRNFLKFNILNQYVWPNAYVGGSYAKEIEYLKDWIAARLNWLDQAIDNTVTGLPERNSNATSIKIVPNPFADELYIQLSDNFPEPEIIIFNMMGEKIIELHPDLLLQSGKISWNAVDRSGSKLAPGIYILVLKSDGRFISSEKLIKN